MIHNNRDPESTHVLRVRQIKKDNAAHVYKRLLGCVNSYQHFLFFPTIQIQLPALEGSL